MAAEQFKARDGTVVADGAVGTFELRHGDYEAVHERMGFGIEGQPVVVLVDGTARCFEQVERVYDEEGIAVGKKVEDHWEVVTGDPVNPAVGFLPENVLTFTQG